MAFIGGAFIVWQKTAKKRMVAKLQAIKAELQGRAEEATWRRGKYQRLENFGGDPGSFGDNAPCRKI
jgi:hypothetical protein